MWKWYSNLDAWWQPSYPFYWFVLFFQNESCLSIMWREEIRLVAVGGERRLNWYLMNPQIPSGWKDFFQSLWPKVVTVWFWSSRSIQFYKYNVILNTIQNKEHNEMQWRAYFLQVCYSLLGMYGPSEPCLPVFIPFCNLFPQWTWA